MKRKCVYPFTAIVGQDTMKKALILNIINPELGGVLIKGEKGTAKSTAVRALAELLPAREEVKGCMFACDPHDRGNACEECMKKMEKGKKIEGVMGKMKVIDLPVSATEDRVVGTLDIEYAIKNGEKKFEKGILAQANRNILYVDEVNLLEDSVVDILLDSAAMGVNTIEREGISYSHPARFVLIGTMNPEEGDLRPQLLDRFGLVVDVIGEKSVDKRVEVIKNRLEFEKNPEEFIAKQEDNQHKLRERIVKAQEMLSKVNMDEKLLEKIARLCIELQVDGHRADISMIKTALTIAAFNGKEKITAEDLIEASELVLPHRMRKRPFEENSFDFELVKRIMEE
ncbi:magnesium chelatase subunit I [Hathewaya proteolytica DSM 3090]|uniref:Magnesium chelatase subunit I n=1 Tax=Hathewaya proteolytica DSM 3090 TaxID=1121331 RepID=A0A1M6KMZ0_9CLOT|nr:AAA family ATPase [Hathewaya proteolytica]SHJ60272.1 magnesium chelatase subunit I [Hathewaya proteolytica DSM 3090]